MISGALADRLLSLEWENGVVRVLALDHGSVRCGCAISDPTGVVVRPLESIDPDLSAVERLVSEHDVELIVVGLPRNLAGEEGSQAELVREFVGELGSGLDVDVVLFDERLTTRMAERSGREGASADRDSLAAAHLLEGWLQSGAGREK